jgi:threonine dehydratase
MPRVVRNPHVAQTAPEGLVSLAEIVLARDRIAAAAICTPLIRAEFPGVGDLSLKAESLQPIGSFKLRGAFNKAASLPADLLSRGLITYSSGNHAQGVAYAARALGTKAVIVMPSNAPEIKRRATEALGATIVTVGPGSQERRQRAEELAAAEGYTIIPPYDDPAIIAGQGTCGLEILEQFPDVDVVLAPVGGGGLLSGVATAIKLQRPDVTVWGVEPELAADATDSLAAGSIVTYTADQTARTLADGLRTQHVGERNFAHIRAFVDGMVTVTEAEIAAAVRAIAQHARLVAEPSGAVACAAALFHGAAMSAAGRRICAIVSGGNAEPAILGHIFSTGHD